MTGIPRALFADADYTLLRAALVRHFEGDAVLALTAQRIFWRCAGPHSDGDWWTGSQSKVAEETGLSPQQVQRAVRRLSDRGELECEKRSGPFNHTLSYRVVTSES